MDSVRSYVELFMALCLSRSLPFLRRLGASCFNLSGLLNILFVQSGIALSWLLWQTQAYSVSWVLAGQWQWLPYQQTSLLLISLFAAWWWIVFPRPFQRSLIWTGWIGIWGLWLTHHWVTTYVMMEMINMVTFLFLTTFQRSHTAMLFYMWSNTLISFLILMAILQDVIHWGGRWVTQLDHWLWSWVMAFKLGWFPFNTWLIAFYLRFSPMVLLWLTTFPKFPFLLLIERASVTSTSWWWLLIVATWCHAAWIFPSQRQWIPFFTVSTLFNSGFLGWLALDQASFPYLAIYVAASWWFLVVILIWQSPRHLMFAACLVLASLPPAQTFFVKLIALHSILLMNMPWLTLLLILLLVRTVAYYLRWSHQASMMNSSRHAISMKASHWISLFMWEGVILFGLV